MWRVLLEQTDLFRIYLRRDNKTCLIQNILYEDYKIKTIDEVDFNDLFATFSSGIITTNDKAFERYWISLYISGTWYDYKIEDSYNDGSDYILVLSDKEEYGLSGIYNDVECKIEFREYKLISESLNIAEYRYKGHNINELIGGAELELMVY